MTFNLKAKKYSFYLIVFFILALIGFHYHTDFYEGDALNFIVADSKFYFELSGRVEGLEDILYLSRNKGNLFGPVFYFDFVMQGNRIAYFLFNAIFCIHAFKSLYKCIEKNKIKNTTLVVFFILLNPVLLFSFSGPNKEITAVLSVMYFSCFILKSGFAFLFFAIVFAVFTRLEMVGYLIVMSVLLMLDYRHRALYLIGILLGLSFIIWVSDYTHIEKLEETARQGSLGVVRAFARASSEGLYFLIFIPKLLINLYGNLVVLNPLKIEGNSINLYISQLLFLFLSFVVIKKKRFVLQNDLVFAFIVYCLVFCVPSFIQHRYFFPLYPLFVLIAFGCGQCKLLKSKLY